MTQAELTPVERASAAFRRMEETARGEQAPLYEHLCRAITNDVELCEMASHTRPHQSIAYLLFDAVHYLLLGGMKHELAEFYPSIAPRPRDAAGVYPVFREFCLAHAAQIVNLIETHSNQTNEVGRMSALLPSIDEAARRGGGKPLGLVEVGPSGGLNLCFDRFNFDYGRVRWGAIDSPVQIRCRLEDEATPPLTAGRPEIAYRIGVDIDPVDVTNDDAARWMCSSTWPDHTDLRALQLAAIEVLRQDPPTIVQMDALQMQPILDAVPAELTLCVYQSFMITQLPEAARERFMAILEAEGERRPVYFVSMVGANFTGGSRRGRVDLHSWINGRYETQQLVEGHSHGRSIRWLG